MRHPAGQGPGQDPHPDTPQLRVPPPRPKPAPARPPRGRAQLRVIDGGKTPRKLPCAARGCTTPATRWTDGKQHIGDYCPRHARMMVPAVRWEKLGIPAKDPEPARKQPRARQA